MIKKYVFMRTGTKNYIKPQIYEKWKKVEFWKMITNSNYFRFMGEGEKHWKFFCLVWDIIWINFMQRYRMIKWGSYLFQNSLHKVPKMRCSIKVRQKSGKYPQTRGYFPDFFINRVKITLNHLIWWFCDSFFSWYLLKISWSDNWMHMFTLYSGLVWVSRWSNRFSCSTAW